MPFVNQSRNMGGTLVSPETLGGNQETFYGAFKIHTFLQSGQFTLASAVCFLFHLIKSFQS